MEGRIVIEEQMHKLESDMKDKRTELEKMQLGKTTLKSFFKSKSTVEKDI